MSSLAMLAFIFLYAFQVTGDTTEASRKHPTITLNSDIVTDASSPSAYQDILNVGIENTIPMGIVIDKDHQLCTHPMDIGHRKIKLSEFIGYINSKVPGYRASLENGVLNVYPTTLGTQASNLLQLKIPEFHSGPDTHQGLGVNLWMFIRAMIAPGWGTAFVGGSSTTRETVPGMQVAGQRVEAILNAIVDKGDGGAWILHSSKVEVLSDKTPLPYEVYGYRGEVKALRGINCTL